VENNEVGIAQQLWCLFDRRQNQHAHRNRLLHRVVGKLGEGRILLLRMVHFEMGLQVIAAREGPHAVINRAGKFTVDRSIDGNSTGGSTDLTSRLMRQSAMPVTLMRSGKRNVALEALEVSHECRSTTSICL
jgi:hypothetical protein